MHILNSKNRKYEKRSTLLNIIKFELLIKSLKRKIKNSHSDIDRI